MYKTDDVERLEQAVGGLIDDGLPPINARVHFLKSPPGVRLDYFYSEPELVYGNIYACMRQEATDEYIHVEVVSATMQKRSILVPRKNWREYIEVVGRCVPYPGAVSLGDYEL